MIEFIAIFNRRKKFFDLKNLKYVGCNASSERGVMTLSLANNSQD